MKKICIVPFTKNEYSLIEFLPPEYVITSLITPMGIGIEGQDISVMRNSSDIGYQFTNSITNGINNADTIIVANIEITEKSCTNMHFRRYLWLLNLEKI